MFIKKIQLKNFKRFSDLTIDLESHGEEAPKLVLLIGANGSGKSCVFDAFEIANRITSDEKLIQASEELKTEKNKGYLSGLGLPDNEYCLKKKDIKAKGKYEFIIDFDKEKRFEFQYESTSETNLIGLSSLSTNLEINKYFYGRSAFRYLPRLTKATIGQVKEETISQNLDRPKTYIDLDSQRLENDFDFLITRTVSEIFNSQIPAQEKLDKVNQLLSEVNSSLEKVFGGNAQTSLRFKEFTTPSGGESAKLLFQKGNSTIHYDLLSAGEKEVVNIIFDLYVRKPYFQDAIYFFDELDLHLNTSLQFDLLKEIVEFWIPEGCQVWVASHSLGFIDYARQSDNAAIIDFDNLDFDKLQELKPEKKGLKNYEIAVPKSLIQDLFRGKKIIVCENKDDELYNSCLIDEKLFVGVPDKNSVFVEAKNNTNYFGLRDRDYLTDKEIQKAKAKYTNLIILQFYCLENYLYHPSNLQEMDLKDFDIEYYKKEICNQKNFIKEKLKIKHLKDDRKSDSLIRDVEDANYYEFIGQKLDSEKFDEFYTFFSMKDFNKQCLEKYKLSRIELAQTQWFQSQIKELLK
jgi:predicted ATPase